MSGAKQIYRRVCALERRAKAHYQGVYMIVKEGSHYCDGMRGCPTTREAIDRLLARGYQVVIREIPEGIDWEEKQ